MTAKRTYADSCGIARALDHAGERWALLVVRELILGPKRFTDLRSGLPGVAPDVLAQRLRDLEASGVIRRHKLPPPAAARVYELTEWGVELEPVLIALGRWGSRAPLPDRPPALSPDALALALETTFEPALATDAETSLTYQMNLGDQDFVVVMSAQGIEIHRGQAANPVLRLETDSATLAALLWHGMPVAQARRDGTLRCEGTEAHISRFLERFPEPRPIEH